MSTPKFRKAKKWLGKDLSLHIGGGDRKVKDTDILEGPQWAKFEGMGFLESVKEEAPAKAPAEKAAPVASEAPAPTGKKDDGSVTKSSAGKLAMGGKTSTKAKEPKKADETKAPEAPAADEKKDESAPSEAPPSDEKKDEPPATE